MYDIIKTHKVGNPVGVIPSGCGTTIENLSIFFFFEKCLYSEDLNTESRVKDTSDMATISDNLNKINTLTSDCKLASFDIMNIFPSADNISGLKEVKSVLDATKDQLPTINIKHNSKHFLQSYGAAQGPRMSCSYSDIAI